MYNFNKKWGNYHFFREYYIWSAYEYHPLSLKGGDNSEKKRIHVYLTFKSYYYINSPIIHNSRNKKMIL